MTLFPLVIRGKQFAIWMDAPVESKKKDPKTHTLIFGELLFFCFSLFLSLFSRTSRINLPLLGNVDHHTYVESIKRITLSLEVQTTILFSLLLFFSPFFYEPREPASVVGMDIDWGRKVVVTDALRGIQHASIDMLVIGCAGVVAFLYFCFP